MFKGKLLTVRQVCELLGVHRSTLDRWVDDGSFPAPWVRKRRRCGRPTSIRWRIEVVMDWLRAAQTAP